MRPLVLAVIFLSLPPAAMASQQTDFIRACTVEAAKKAPQRIPAPIVELKSRERCECIVRHVDDENQRVYLRFDEMSKLEPGDPRIDLLLREMGTDDQVIDRVAQFRSKFDSAWAACDRTSDGYAN